MGGLNILMKQPKNDTDVGYYCCDPITMSCFFVRCFPFSADSAFDIVSMNS